MSHAAENHFAPDSLDFASARAMMVDDQVRPVEVNDPRIITAMRALPRELCLPRALRSFAYSDGNLDLGNGRCLTQPMVTGRLAQAAAPVAGERALVVAAGPGYMAALLSRLGLKVTALDSDATLLAAGQTFTDLAAPEVVWQEGTLNQGWAAAGPYDLILIDGTVRDIPEFCAAQLAPRGRVACMKWPAGGVSSAVIAERGTDGWAEKRIFDVNVPLIEELAPAPAFSF